MHYLNTDAQIIMFRDMLNSEIYVDKSSRLCATMINRYNVIHIDFSVFPDFCDGYDVYLKNILRKLQEDLRETYPALKGREYGGISEMLSDTKDSFIFILDEWDSVFSEKYVTEADKIHFLRFLKTMLKDRPYVDLAYMTGVLPIAKYSSGSELNKTTLHKI